MATLAFRIHGLARTLVRLDPVWLAFGLVLAGLVLFQPAQAGESAVFVLEAMLGMAPFLLLSVAVGAYAQASGADHLIAKAFSGHTTLMIVSAALVGALSPFCSCGVIPLIAALLAMGVPLPAVMAFWLASPIIDPAMFVLTLGTLGLEFALYKALAAVGIGLFGGFGTAILMKLGGFAEPLRSGIGNGGCAGAKIRNPQAVAWRFWEEATRRASFFKSALQGLRFLGKWLLLAFLLESLLLAYVPAAQVAGLLGGEGWQPVVLATFLGIPAYLNGYAALPLIGGLLEQGMSPAAGMAFLLAGSVTSIPAAMAVFALARTPVFSAYIGFALSGSLLLALGYGLVEAIL